MSDSRPRRRVADSVVNMTEIVLPEDSNPRGWVFGGRVLALVDKCAAIVAMRHARSEVVTASLDSVVFVNRVMVGDVLALSGRINAAFGSSMEIEVLVHAERPATGERTLTTRALVTMVGVGPDGRPRIVADLEPADDAERERAGAADARRRDRLRERGV
jgi:acyl-CoA hydrolase